MFEIFIQERKNGDESGFEKKIDSYLSLQDKMAKLGIDEGFEAGSTLKKKNRFKGAKSHGWTGTLRKLKRGELPSTSLDSRTVIGTPTLVTSTTERTDGTKIAPPVPAKINEAPTFHVPSKPLPKAPVTSSQRPLPPKRTPPVPVKSNSNSDFSNRVPPARRERNTWKPQTNSDFSRKLQEAGGESPQLSSARGRGRGRGMGGGSLPKPRQRPVSVRPGFTASEEKSPRNYGRPLPSVDL